MFEHTDPKKLKFWLIVAAAIYFIMPFDLIPDFLGIHGRIDDFAVMGYLAWFYRNHVQQYMASHPGRSEGPSGGRDRRETGPRTREPKSFDAHEVLGIPRSASSDAIKAAYRSKMQEYHPDKVAHLGEDLQKLAHEKSQEIQRAYRELTK